MSFYLRSYEITPGGGYTYSQVSGVPKTFDAQPDIIALAHQVVAFRQQNNLPFASLADAVRHISRQTCARLGNDPTWCYESGDPAPIQLNQSSPVIAPCAGCGAPV